MKRTIIIALSVVALVFGVISYATAETTTGPNNTTVTASVQGVFQLTAVEAAANLGAIDPENPGSDQVTVGYKSNFPATLTAEILSSSGFTSLSSGIGSTGASVRGNDTIDDTITGTVDWNVDPGTALTGTIRYTLTRP